MRGHMAGFSPKVLDKLLVHGQRRVEHLQRDRPAQRGVFSKARIDYILYKGGVYKVYRLYSGVTIV